MTIERIRRPQPQEGIESFTGIIEDSVLQVQEVRIIIERTEHLHEKQPLKIHFLLPL